MTCYFFHSTGEPWLFPLSVGWSEPFGCLMLAELKVDSRHHDLTKPSVATRHSAHISEPSFGCLTQLIIVCIYATVCLRSVIIQAQLPRYISDVQMAQTQMFTVLLVQADCHTPCVKMMGYSFFHSSFSSTANNDTIYTEHNDFCLTWQNGFAITFNPVYAGLPKLFLIN